MSDHSDFQPFSDDRFGLEKGNLDRFNMANTVRRPGQAPNKFDVWDALQLPNNAVLHTLNGFETLVSPDQGLPSTTIPLVNNEKYPVYLRAVTQVSNADSLPLGVGDAYVYRAGVMNAHLNHFFSSHRQYHQVMSERILGTMAGVLAWVDYSALNELHVNGTLHDYRKFEILFRTILNKICQIGEGRNHYLVLPQSNHVYQRSALGRTFLDLSNGTLAPFQHDPSIFPILHVLGYVYGKTHPGKVKPSKNDIATLGKDNDLYATLRSTSLFERIPKEMFGSINLVFQKDNRAIIYNLAELDQFSDDDSFYQRFYRHIMNLRITAALKPSHVDADSDQFDTLIDAVAPSASGAPAQTVLDPAHPTDSALPASAATPVPVTAPKQMAPDVVTHVTGSADPVIPIAPTPATSFNQRVEVAAYNHTAPARTQDDKKESRHETLINNHLAATFRGKTLAEWSEPPASQAVAVKPMTFLTGVPETSYQTSSLNAMDQAYQEHMYHHELAKVISSLAKHGMFVSKIEEDALNTEMDRTVTYKVHLNDISGKSHHVKFTVPDIDKNGLMKLGGIEYRLTRQIANVPICKVNPFRVNLSSYYNKIIVERIIAKRFSYEQDLYKHLFALRTEGKIGLVIGTASLPESAVSYDYTAIGRSITEATIGDYHLHFGVPYVEWKDLPVEVQEQIKPGQMNRSVIAGGGSDGSLILWGLHNEITIVKDQKILYTWTSFQKFLVAQLGEDGALPKTPIEWTQASILNQTIPLVMLLAYRIGLKELFKSIHLTYRFYPDVKSAEVGTDDISIRFADGVMVFNRYPISKSLIATGLTWVNLKDTRFADMSLPETYLSLFQQQKMSAGVLEGITKFFDFFVDPITETVLQKMGEPIHFGDLLLRASSMLTDYYAEESSSMKLYRFRRYERFNGMVYNQIYRGLAAHRGNPSSKKSFSINPQAVFINIVQDATVSPNDVINPIHEVKQNANITFTGSGGRAPDSFVMTDRIFPKDAVGVMSEAVPDSGKVGITAYLSASPKIDDVHGLPTPYRPGTKLTPEQILSIGGMVMPNITTDDGKRASYTSIQLSHYVPNQEDGETLSVRTGYDAVLPHLVGETFATAAEEDGTVEEIDFKHQVIRVRYADQPLTPLRKLTLPYLESVIDRTRITGGNYGVLITEADLKNYPIGAIMALTKTTYGKITDRIRITSADAIPDKDAAKKQNDLVQMLAKGTLPVLYYVRLSLMGTTTPGHIKSYSFANAYTPISGAYLKQTRLPNVKQGDVVKRGDILAYNPGFFVPDPMSKQVTFKHGVTAWVALIEKPSNHEDACEISEAFGRRLKMTPCHQKPIITNNTAAILAYAKVGDHVETSSNLCVISDDYLVGSDYDLNSENLDIMAKLNRQTPSAGYTGEIRKIRILYACEREDLSESLKAILKGYEKEVRDEAKALAGPNGSKPPERPGWVAPGTRYQGVEFAKDTVMLEFMIEETLGMSAGDKMVVANANKSIVSLVAEEQHYTESGIPIDVLFSTTSIVNRLVASPFSIGIGERVMEETKKQALAIYFGT